MFNLVAPEQVAGLAWWPLAAALVALVVINMINNRVAPQSHYLLWAFGGSVVLLAIGLLDGDSGTDIGPSIRYLIPGLIWAIVISSVIFGLWHVLPSMGIHEHKPALGSAVGKYRRGNILAIAGRRGIAVRSAERLVSRTFTALGLDDDARVNPRVAATRIPVRNFGVLESPRKLP